MYQWTLFCVTTDSNHIAINPWSANTIRTIIARVTMNSPIMHQSALHQTHAQSLTSVADDFRHCVRRNYYSCCPETRDVLRLYCWLMTSETTMNNSSMSAETTPYKPADCDKQHRVQMLCRFSYKSSTIAKSVCTSNVWGFGLVSLFEDYEGLLAPLRRSMVDVGFLIRLTGFDYWL